MKKNSPKVTNNSKTLPTTERGTCSGDNGGCWCTIYKGPKGPGGICSTCGHAASFH